MNASTKWVFVPFVFLSACASTGMPPAGEQNMQSSPSLVQEKGLKDSPSTADTQTGPVEKTSQRLSAGAPPASWELSGAMAARSKNKAWSASVNWTQNGASSYQIRLFGPLGSGTVMISRQGGLINFRDGPKSSTSKNAEQLLQQQTGVRLPVNNLYYWVRGIPAPGAVQSVKKDAGNRLQILRQGGYTIEYLGYNMYGSTALPSKIRLQGNGVFIKMIIKRWKV